MVGLQFYLILSLVVFFYFWSTFFFLIKLDLGYFGCFWYIFQFILCIWSLNYMKLTLFVIFFLTIALIYFLFSFVFTALFLIFIFLGWSFTHFYTDFTANLWLLLFHYNCSTVHAIWLCFYHFLHYILRLRFLAQWWFWWFWFWFRSASRRILMKTMGFFFLFFSKLLLCFLSLLKSSFL